MKRKQLLLFSFLLLASVLISGWFLLSEKKDEQRKPLSTIVREGDEDEKDERDKFEAWYEYMHKAAPGVNWRKMDAETRAAKYAMRPPANPNARSRMLETLANGNLVGEWNERGSANQAGRIWVADLDTSNGAVYCGSDGGNVWKGDINGNGWTVLNDKLKFDIKMLRILPNGNGKRLIASGGAYVHYTDDDGITWQTANGLSNLASWGSIKRSIVLDDSLQTMYVLVHEWDYTNWNGIHSIYKSTDHATSFSLVASYSEPVYGSIDNFDLWAPRYGTANLAFIENDSVFYLDRITDAFSFVSTINIATPGYTVLAGYKNGSAYSLYAHIGQDLYKSTDGGVSWNAPVNTSINIFSPTSFSCSCTDPNHLYLGDIECHYSLDAGNTWAIVNSWWTYYTFPATTLHADLPSITPLKDAQGNEFLFVGTDGGLYTSFDNLQTVNNISLHGLNVSQYYSVYTNRNDPNFIYAGAQDQGFQRCGNDSAMQLGFDQVVSGDYGHICSSDNGMSIWMNYPGFTDYYAYAPTGNSTANWQFNGTIPFWIPPLMADPLTPNIAYVAGGNLNGTGSHMIQLVENGGQITPYEDPYDFSAASAGGNISAMACSPINSDYRYVMTDNGKFFRSSDAGVTWTMSNVAGLGGHYLYGATIYPSHTTLGVVYVGGSGYSNWPAYRSSNHGQNFISMANGIPHTHIFELTGNFNDSLIFAATEVGPYVYVVAENKWYDMEGVGAPDQSYWSVEYLAASNTVRFATYGRGIWDFAISYPSVAIHENVVQQNNMNLYPNPATDQFRIRLSAANGGTATMRIIAVDGKIAAENSFGIGPGENEIPVSCATLAKGIYFVEVKTAEANYTERIIVR